MVSATSKNGDGGGVMDSLMGRSQISRDISDNKVDLEALIMAYQDGIVRICSRYARDANEAEERV